MKKLIVLFVAVFALCSLTACGAEEEKVSQVPMDVLDALNQITSIVPTIDTEDVSSEPVLDEFPESDFPTQENPIPELEETSNKYTIMSVGGNIGANDMFPSCVVLCLVNEQTGEEVEFFASYYNVPDNLFAYYEDIYFTLNLSNDDVIVDWDLFDARTGESIKGISFEEVKTRFAKTDSDWAAEPIKDGSIFMGDVGRKILLSDLEPETLYSFTMTPLYGKYAGPAVVNDTEHNILYVHQLGLTATGTEYMEHYVSNNNPVSNSYWNQFQHQTFYFYMKVISPNDAMSLFNGYCLSAWSIGDSIQADDELEYIYNDTTNVCHINVTNCGQSGVIKLQPGEITLVDCDSVVLFDSIDG